MKPRLSLIKLSGSKNVTQIEDKRNENYTLSPIKIATSQIQLHLHKSEISLQHFDQKDLFLKDRVKHQILKNFVKKNMEEQKEYLQHMLRTRDPVPRKMGFCTKFPTVC